MSSNRSFGWPPAGLLVAVLMAMVWGCSEKPLQWLRVDRIDGPAAADVVEVVASTQEGEPEALARTADHLWVRDRTWKATRAFDGGTFAAVEPPSERDSIVWATDRWWWLEPDTDGGPTLRVSKDGREWSEFDLPGSARDAVIARTQAEPQSALSLVVEGATLYLTGPARIWRLDASGEEIWHRVQLDGVGSLEDSEGFPAFIQNYLPRSGDRNFELLTVFSGQLRVYRRFEPDADWMMVSTIGPVDLGLVASISGDVVFIVTVDGVYRSNDEGETWFRFWPNDAAGLTACVVIEDSASEVGYALLAGTADGTILHSADQGGSWQTVLEGGPAAREISSLTIGADRLTVWAGTRGTGIWRSNDGGKKWERDNEGLDDARPLAVSHRDDGAVVLADAGGVWVLSGGLSASWNALNSRYPSSVLGTGDGRVVTGTVDGTVSIQSSREDLVEIETLFREGSGPLLLPNRRSELLELRSVVALRQRPGTDTFYAWSKGRGVAVSRDGGAAWEELALDPSLIDALGEQPLVDVQLDGEKGIYLAQRMDEGGVRVWYSPDDGTSWRAIREVESSDAQLLVLGPKEANAAIIVHAGMLEMSIDGGKKWRTVDGPWAGMDVLAVDYDDGTLALLVDSRPGFELVTVDRPSTVSLSIRRFALRWPKGPPVSGPRAFQLHRGEILMMGREALWRISRPGAESALPAAATYFALALGVLAACAVVFFAMRRFGNSR